MRRNIGSFWFSVVGIALLVAGIGAAKMFWSWLHPDDPTDVSNSETLRNIGLLIGGALAFVFAGWRAWIAERQANAAQEQANTAQRTLLNDQYQRGADMLSSDVLAVRLAGIYALQSLAQQQPEAYHIQIMRLFCAFVRNLPKDDILDKPVIIEGEEMLPPIREDAQAALSAIGQRSSKHMQLENEKGFRVDLHGANLRKGDVRGCLLGRADLTWANLTEADLENANLAGALLNFADLSGAKMSGADFQSCICRLASVSLAKAHETNLTRADLEGTIWFDAELENASLSFATLRGADLRRANLAGTDVTGTVFGNGGRRTEHYSDGMLAISARQAYTSLTQEQLDQTTAADGCPPEIEPGTTDAETNVPLEWQG